MATLILFFSTCFSRLDAYDGRGITYDFKWILSLSASVLLIGLLILYFPDTTTIVIDVISWILGTIGVSIVFIDFMYVYIKR